MRTAAENDALNRDDLRVLRRLAVTKRHDLRRRTDVTADVTWAYDVLIAKLDRAVNPVAAPDEVTA